MPSVFQGYLIKAVLTNTILPLKFIQYDSYKATPNQREEIKAYRDDNTRDLTRVTASGMKSVIEFKLRPMWLEEKIEFQHWLNSGIENIEENRIQRKIELQYWDDEENVYKTGYFYVPNIDYNILKITDKSIKYKETTIKFIEY
jgi:hypothetical protein